MAVLILPGFAPIVVYLASVAVIFVLTRKLFILKPLEQLLDAFRSLRDAPQQKLFFLQHRDGTFATKPQEVGALCTRKWHAIYEGTEPWVPEAQAEADDDVSDPVYVDDDPDCLDEPVPAEYGDEYQS